MVRKFAADGFVDGQYSSSYVITDMEYYIRSGLGQMVRRDKLYHTRQLYA